VQFARYSKGDSQVIEWSLFLFTGHLIGLALAVGSATVKLVLLFRCRAYPTFASTFLKVSKPITRLIILGMILLLLTGIGRLILLGYGFTPALIVKLILFAAIWVLGPVIDNVVEPRFQKQSPGQGEAPTPAFVGALKRYLVWETVATSLFYVIIVIWVFKS
jgi:hypothetical protein